MALDFGTFCSGPVRFEVGLKDLAAIKVSVSVSHSGEKFQPSLVDIEANTSSLLNRIHDEMFAKAKAERESCVKVAECWDDLIAALNSRCSALMPWCEERNVAPRKYLMELKMISVPFLWVPSPFASPLSSPVPVSIRLVSVAASLLRATLSLVVAIS